MLDTRHGFRRLAVHSANLAAKNRTGADGGIQHAGQAQIHAIDLAAIKLFRRIQPRDGFAGDFPALRILQGNIRGRCQPRGRFRHLAEAGAAPAWAVGDDAIGHAAFAGRNTPAIGRCLHQHHARRRTALADIIMAVANAAAATGGHISPGAIARQVLARCWIFGGHLGPIAFQFLSDQLREACQRALPHFRPRDADHDRVIRPHHDPDIDLRHASTALRGSRFHQRRMKAKGEGAKGGRHRRQQATAGRMCDGIHDAVPPQPLVLMPAARWMPARTRL